MNQLETFLQQPLPQGEAAAFFIRLKGGEKVATPEEAYARFAALPEEERAEILKLANATMGYPGAPAQLPAAAKGNVMPTPPPTPLPSTAMGQNSGPPKLAAAKHDARDVGKERGEANAAAHFERESHRHGERSGTTLGRVAGLAAGAAAAHKLGKGNPMVDIAGAALGHHVGGQLGRHAGKAHDERAFKKHAEAFKEALEGMGMQQPGQPQPQTQQGQQDLASPPGIEPKLDPQMAEYLATEQQADTQAMSAELAHARAALSAAMESQQQLEAKAQQLETKQQMTDSQLAQYQAQVADATQSAMGAQDQVLQQQQAAAAMRIAYQQLRGQLLQAASVDPPSLSGNEAALAAASSAAGPSSGPAPQQGPADQAGSPGTAPNSAAPTGDDQVSARSQTTQQSDTSASSQSGQKDQADGAKIPGKESLASASLLLPFVGAEKVAALRDFLSNAMHEGMSGLKAVAPHAAVGGLIGGGLGLAESQMSNEPLRQKVQELEAKGDQRSTGDAISLAMSRGRLTLGEHAAKHPVASTAIGALTGAMTGARGGPAFVGALKSMKDDVGGIASDLKTIRGK